FSGGVVMRIGLPLCVILVLCASGLPCATADTKAEPKAKLSEEEQKLLEMTNAAREKEQVPPLQPSAVLCEVARAHSANMAKQRKQEHTLDGKNASDRVQAAGYEYVSLGENIISGRRCTPRDAFAGWMDSPPHRDNILKARFQEVGIGVASNDQGEVYYTEVFALPRKKGGGKEPANPFAEAAQKLLDLTNNARAKEKLPPLKPNAMLAKAAQAHAENMARQGKLEHTLDGKGLRDRLQAAGYDADLADENLASAPGLLVQQVFDSWMGSQLHHDVILGEKFQEA